MRINIPSFRLPASVLDEEVGYILDMGVDIKYNSPVTSMRALLDEPWDAVFIGSGAPTGKNLDIPGRREAARNIHIGIEWLASAHFGHIERIGRRVLIIGVGNTAMDCCRTSRRLGGADVKVIARRSRPHFKASAWELDDAEEEGVEIVENHAPKRFVLENGRLVGLELDRLRWSDDVAGGKPKSDVVETVVIPCDDVILAIGQENAFPWIERDVGIDFDGNGMPVVDRTTMQSTRPGVFFGGDAAWGPQNIIWAVEHGHQAAISIDNRCQDKSLAERLPFGMHLLSSKVGMHSWSYSNDYSPVPRTKMQHAELTRRFASLGVEVELGFTAEETAREVERCLNCDIETHFTESLCIECDACVDVCPVSCLTIAPDVADDFDLRTRLSAPAVNPTQALFTSPPLPQTKRLMVKDEDVCLHCGLCAERCPTAAWDMRQFELIVPYAGRARAPELAIRGPAVGDGNSARPVQNA
jgi:NADPH-dependent glutamate synthase beta subunit-like oxidoreductase